MRRLTELSPFNYTVVVFSGILGWWLFGDVPDAVAVLGTVLICAGGILSIEAGHAEGPAMRLEAGTGCLTGSSGGPNSTPRNHKFYLAVLV